MLRKPKLAEGFGPPDSRVKISNMRIVVTGATGFIGSAIVAEALERNWEVIVLLRANSDLTRLRPFESKCTLLRYERLDSDHLLSGLLELRPEVFIHSAWQGVGGRDRNEAYQVTQNLPLTIDSVTLAAAAGCRQWIGLGSQAEYGNQNNRLGEEAPTKPTSIYGRSKLAAGSAGLALCQALGMTGAWTRVFSTYGPGDADYWFIPYVIQEFLANRVPKLTKCEQKWDYLYIEDAARAIAAVVESKLDGVFNLGSGQARPLKEVVAAIQMKLGSPLNPEYGAISYRPDQVMYLEADITRLTTASGWMPQVGLDEGIKRTIAGERERNQAATHNKIYSS
jgi:nucleoside-diphosphate-sugar epimerase